MRSITLPQVLLVLGLIAGIVLAHRFAPGVGESVISLVGLVIAYVLPSPFKDTPKPPDAGPLAVLFACVFAVTMSGCELFTGKYAGVDKLEDEITKTSDQIETCKQRARMVRANEDASTDDALAVFDRCMATDGGAK